MIGDSLHERRLVIYLVSEEHLQDKACFDPIYADLKSGGYEEFLHYLLHIELGDWHPRQQLKTAELAQHQRMSGDSITQWARACVEADLLVGGGQGSCGISHGQRIQSEDLRQSHAWYCKQQSLRPANEVVFGEACTMMFGRRQRLSTQKVTEILGGSAQDLVPGKPVILQAGNNRRAWGGLG